MGDIDTHRLDSETTTVVFSWVLGIPEISYLGSRLTDELDLNLFVRSRAMPHGFATLDTNHPITMQPEASRGFMGHPGLIAYRQGSGNQRPAQWDGQFQFSSLQEIERGVLFQCLDQQRGLVLEINCTLCSLTGVAVFKSKLINNGTDPLVVEWLSAPALPVSQELSEYMHFHGRWCAEFDVDRRRIPIGSTKNENRRGRTSHEAFPGGVLVAPAADEAAGSCMGVHLGWSGNHRMVLERMTTGECQLQMGVLYLAGEGWLPSGEVMESPDLYVAWSDHGLNHMSQKFHTYIRSSILKFPAPEKPRPVTVNTWEALYFDHDP